MARLRRTRRLFLKLSARPVSRPHPRPPPERGREQALLNRCVVDFCGAVGHLCIEIDGDSHAGLGQAAYDAARTAALNRGGYRVLRFTNGQFETNLSAVLEAICAACEPPSPPPSSPTRQGTCGPTGEGVRRPSPDAATHHPIIWAFRRGRRGKEHPARAGKRDGMVQAPGGIRHPAFFRQAA